MAVIKMTHDFSCIRQFVCCAILALFLLTYKKGLKLKLALGETSGQRGSLDLDVRNEEEEATTNNGGVLAHGWWRHSQRERERTLKGDQVQHDIDEFGFGQVFVERSKSYNACIWIC